MKKVLLLGGAGFIGYNITKYLAENRDYEISIADNFFRQGGKIDDLLQALIDKHNTTQSTLPKFILHYLSARIIPLRSWRNMRPWREKRNERDPRRMKTIFSSLYTEKIGMQACRLFQPEGDMCTGCSTTIVFREQEKAAVHLFVNLSM